MSSLVSDATPSRPGGSKYAGSVSISPLTTMVGETDSGTVTTVRPLASRKTVSFLLARGTYSGASSIGAAQSGSGSLADGV